MKQDAFFLAAWAKRGYLRLTPQARPPEKRCFVMLSGYIYFLKGPNNLVKIGRTKDLTHRIRTLTRLLDFDVKLVGAFHTSEASRVEAIIHNRLSDCHHEGEWYFLPEKKMYKVIRHFSHASIEMM